MLHIIFAFCMVCGVRWVGLGLLECVGAGPYRHCLLKLELRLFELDIVVTQCLGDASASPLALGGNCVATRIPVSDAI